MVGSECSSQSAVIRRVRGAAMRNAEPAALSASIVQKGAGEEKQDEDSPLETPHRFIIEQQDEDSPLKTPPRFTQEAEGENDETDGDKVKKRPLHYWDDLRESGIPYETREGSAMFRLTDNNETVRLAHIANVYPYSEVLSDGTRIPNESLIYIEAGMFLALKTFNERSPSVLPDLPDRLKDCNIHLTMDILDSMLSPIVASRKALSELNRPDPSLENPFPVSLAGAFRSAVSQPLATLSGVYQVPHVNGQSTSAVLDNKDQAPTFVRVVPTNRLDAKAYTLYLKSLGVHHFGVLHVRDAYGSEFSRDLRVAAHESGMHMMAASYQDGDNQSIDLALKTLKSHKHRYIFTVITPSAGTLKYIIREAINLDMLGNPEHFWMFSEAVTALVEPGFYETTLDSSLESDREIASALSGTGLVLLEIPKNEQFDNAMQELGRDSEIYDYFVSRHDAPEMFDNFKFNPAPNFYQSLSYDAIMALGIGLCGMSEEFPTGIDIVEAVKATEFVGVSGPVKFDNFTGTRTADGLNFKVVNLIVDPSEESIQFEARTSSLIDMTSGEVNVLSPFVYSGGTLAPPQLPMVDVDLNLLSNGVRAFGWILAALTIFLSAGFAIWTWTYKRRNLVRVAQPIFLVLLCVGTTLMASAIIPLSLQEPVSDRGLDIACMAVPWLFIMGFAAAVASMCCKLLRINKVVRQSADMHRVQVKAKDMFLPFAIYMLLNFAILLAWTLVAPLRWTRVATMHVDTFGRSLESYGTCVANQQDGKNAARIAFAITIVLLNFGAVLYANWQSYLSRHLPSAFNETLYLGVSMVGVLEGFLIGAPMLFFAVDDPTASYVVVSILISFICLALLLPTFVSKLIMRRRAETMDKAEWRDVWNKIDSQENHRRSHSSVVSRHSHHGDGSTSAFDSVEQIRRRVAQKAKEESASELSTEQKSGAQDSVEDSRRRVDQKAKKESSQQRIKRTG